LSGAPVVVSFPAPAISGGRAPFQTSCTPASGSTFPVGATNVVCTLRDADQRATSCGFTVTVTRPPQLTATRFLAFGDSVTSGKAGNDCTSGGALNCRLNTFLDAGQAWLNDLLRLDPRLGEESPFAYPRVLQTMLAARYAAQTITIPNAGNSGELVSAGKVRLTSTLNTEAPQVLLLQEGANDMTGGRPPIEAIVNDFRAMVRDAQGRGIRVFIGTLLPQREGACRGYDFCDGVNDIVPTNAALRTMAAAEGAVLVDLHQEFVSQTNTLLDLDGLHPNEAGYRKIAEMFFAAIRERLEAR
jgi:lysophospholipase L1-like esterase